ncbi:MAG: hypothetical protein QHC90_24445 [Shinella sp.]|nr:hypothetical protein [Shinella sp.]
MGSRRLREAQQQTDRLLGIRQPYRPRLPALARIIMGSGLFRRLMNWLDAGRSVTRRLPPAALPSIEQPQGEQPPETEGLTGIGR